MDDPENSAAASQQPNGNAPGMVRTMSDDIIHQQFKALQDNLDDVLGQTEELDELTPVMSSKDNKDGGGCGWEDKMIKVHVAKYVVFESTYWATLKARVFCF